MEQIKSDYTVRDLAALLGIHPETLRRLARAGRLPGAYKVGTRWRFAREAIEDLRGEVTCSTYHTDIDLSVLDGEGLE
jgi:excisionase family DNA binding protein